MTRCLVTLLICAAIGLAMNYLLGVAVVKVLELMMLVL